MIKRMLFSLLLTNTVIHTNFPITMKQNKDKTWTFYQHGERASGAWYYYASYDKNTGIYCTFRPESIIDSLDRSGRRPSNTSFGPAGSDAAQTYERLEKLYQEQEASKPECHSDAEKQEEPTSVSAIDPRYCNFLEKFDRQNPDTFFPMYPYWENDDSTQKKE